jgi:hypothetical protein
MICRHGSSMGIADSCVLDLRLVCSHLSGYQTGRHCGATVANDTTRIRAQDKYLRWVPVCWPKWIAARPKFRSGSERDSCAKNRGVADGDAGGHSISINGTIVLDQTHLAPLAVAPEHATILLVLTARHDRCVPLLR